MAKILLADDSIHAQRMGAKILSAEGFEVTTVSNGQAAIQTLKKLVPDLVVADVFMPGRNGYEVCQFVKADPKFNHIPVLLLIGAMEPYDPEAGRRAGADGLITKPLESSNLVATVQDLLAAAKKSAPTRPPAAKEAPAQKTAQVPETPEWGIEEEEFPVAEQKLEIPQEMSQQAVGMFTDLLDTGEADEAKPTGAAESFPMEAAEPSRPLPEPDTLSAVEVEEQTIWTAEPAAITAEEEKLFEQPAATWGDLAQLVEENGPEVPSPEPVLGEAQPAPAWEQAMQPPVEQPPLMEAPTPAEEAATPPPPALPWAAPVEEPQPAPAPPEPPALEQLVREAVEDVMPQIVERVRQSLKT